MIKVQFIVDYKMSAGRSFTKGDQVSATESNEIDTMLKHGVLKNVDTGEQQDLKSGSFKITPKKVIANVS